MRRSQEAGAKIAQYEPEGFDELKLEKHHNLDLRTKTEIMNNEMRRQRANRIHAQAAVKSLYPIYVQVSSSSLYTDFSAHAQALLRKVSASYMCASILLLTIYCTHRLCCAKFN